MHAFDIFGDPVRRRILELLADGEQTSGAITEVVRAELALSQRWTRIPDLRCRQGRSTSGRNMT